MPAMNDAVYFHSQSARRWESNYKKKGFSVRKDILHQLLPARNIAGQNWLDAGCGTGTLTRFLAEAKGCNTLGVDASAEMIDNCVSVACSIPADSASRPYARSG